MNVLNPVQGIDRPGEADRVIVSEFDCGGRFEFVEVDELDDAFQKDLLQVPQFRS